MSSARALEVDNLSVRLMSPRGVVMAVNGISFGVQPGRIHGIVGESGSGKTTVLKSILGLLPGHAVVTGRVLVDGESVALGSAHGSGAKTRVGIVFQEPMTALNPVMTVGRQIAEAPYAVLGIGKRLAKERAIELMKQVGIPDPERRFHAYPHELSGGLRQRILIAIALSSDPDVLLCDEPTTALDATIQDQILRLFRQIADDTCVALVFVTHDLAVVAQTCRTVSVMYAGRFVETGTVSEVFEHPLHPYTRGLLRAVPDMSRGGSRLEAIPGMPPDLVDLPGGCPFRPRCDFGQNDCEQSIPDLETVAPGRATACIHHQELQTMPTPIVEHRA